MAPVKQATCKTGQLRAQVKPASASRGVLLASRAQLSCTACTPQRHKCGSRHYKALVSMLACFLSRCSSGRCSSAPAASAISERQACTSGDRLAVPAVLSRPSPYGPLATPAWQRTRNRTGWMGRGRACCHSARAAAIQAGCPAPSERHRHMQAFRYLAAKRIPGPCAHQHDAGDGGQVEVLRAPAAHVPQRREGSYRQSGGRRRRAHGGWRRLVRRPESATVPLIAPEAAEALALNTAATGARCGQLCLASTALLGT